jgi:LysM repeat protein
MATDRSHQKLEELIEQALRDGTTELDLKKKDLTELPESIGQLTKLVKLYLNDNELEAIPESIGRLTNLQHLDIGGNQITIMPESIGELRNLQSLYISRNQLSKLPESIGWLTNLRALDLNRNQLSALPESIGQLTSLHRLSVGENQLITFPEPIVQLTNLMNLNFSRNKLSKLPVSIRQLKNLEALDLGRNQLRGLPEGVVELTNLKRLTLSYNDISLLPEAIGKLEKLENLNLDGNKLKTLPVSISQLENLKNLSLKKNPLDKDLAASFERGLGAVKKYLSGQRRQQKYTVKSGDTITKIAEKFGISTNGIIQVNRIEDPNIVPVGTDLIIPDKTTDKMESARSESEQPMDLDKHTTEPISPRAWVETDSIPVIGNFRDYRPSEYDSLDAKEQAEIFATLLIAKDVHPPFALGLLGDWGVGKTFFMRLMQEKVTSIAGKNAQIEESHDSVSRAAQIEFNAWHYIDSDLWASLASHIFDGLSEELRGRKERVEDIRRRLRRTIHSSRREQEQAYATIDASQKAREKFSIALDESQEKRVQLAAECDSYRLKRIWEAVLKVKPNPNDPDQKNWPNLDEMRTKAENTAKRVGLTEAINSIEEVQRVYTSLRDILRRGSSLTVSLSTTFTGERLWLSVPIVLILLVIILGWPLILEQIETLIGASENTITNLLAPFLQLGTIVVAAATWVGKHLNSLSSALGYLEKIQAEINKPRFALKEPSKEEKDLKERIEKLDAEIATEQRRIEEADRQIAEAQAEIQRINAGGLVYDFIEGRIHDSQYLDRLGLISVIRRDFEELGSLLRDWRKHGESADSAGNSSPQPSWDMRPIERIILYIDDLDRCPPKRVVEVLQAVHLILAFDLFVVVVAVDGRWLERSLNEAYNPKKAERDGFSIQEPVHRFSAHNYLEKIFQIPFSLPAMEEPGYRQLVADMIATPRRQAEWASKRSEERRLQLEKEQTTKEEVPSVSVGMAQPEDSTREKDLDMSAEVVNRADTDQDDNTEKERQRREEKERREREQQETLERIEAMLLLDHEEQFIKALFPFIATPRLAKRFLNIYRLIRLRAASREEDFKTFIDPEHGDYRAVLVLLAISVGRTEVASEILNDLAVGPIGRRRKFTTWLQNAYKKDDKTRLQLDEEPKANNVRSDINEYQHPVKNQKKDLQGAALGIRNDIKVVIEALDAQNGPSFDHRLKTYRKWVNEVGRFSFRWHLKADM